MVARVAAHALAIGQVVVEVPTTVAALMFGQPGEPTFDGGLRGRRATFGHRQAFAITRLPSSQCAFHAGRCRRDQRFARRQINTKAMLLGSLLAPFLFQRRFDGQPGLRASRSDVGTHLKLWLGSRLNVERDRIHFRM
jgi:hypothetical protein